MSKERPTPGEVMRGVERCSPGSGKGESKSCKKGRACHEVA